MDFELDSASLDGIPQTTREVLVRKFEAVKEAAVASASELAALQERLGGVALDWYFDNLFLGTVAAPLLGDGTVSRVLGGLQLDSSDTENDGVTVNWGTAETPQPIVPGGADKVWGFTAVVKLGELDDAALAFVGLEGGASFVHFGGLEGDFFAAETENGSIVSAVPLDEAWHRVRLYRRAGITYFEMDGVVVGSSALLYPTDAVGFAAGSFNNSAVSRTLIVHEVGAAVPPVL